MLLVANGTFALLSLRIFRVRHGRDARATLQRLSRVTELLLLDDSLAFLDRNDSVRADVPNPLNTAAGPPNFNEVYPGALLESEVDPHIVLGNVTAAAVDLSDLG